MPIVTTDDFVGKWEIAAEYDGSGNEATDLLQAYIDHYENEYMNKLLGAALYVLYLADPLDPIYAKLTDAFAFDSEAIVSGPGKVQVSEGLEVMLKNFIYAHFIREDLGFTTPGGVVNLTPEAGSRANDNETNVFVYYNQGVKTYKAIQQWIKENLTDYPDFNGQKIGMQWLI